MKIRKEKEWAKEREEKEIRLKERKKNVKEMTLRGRKQENVKVKERIFKKKNGVLMSPAWIYTINSISERVKKKRWDSTCNVHCKLVDSWIA